MIHATILLSAVLTTLAPAVDDLTPADDLAPGRGLGLAPDGASGPVISGTAPGAVTGGGLQGTPLGAAVALGAVAAGVAAVGGIRTGGDEEDPIVVMVPGWGSSSGRSVFGELVDLMGVDGEDVRYFDYRWATGAQVHAAASTEAHVEQTATALNGFVAGVAAETDRDVFLVGFSKGGVTVAEMIARWDDGGGGVEGVSGAVILDAPMASGAVGWTQSLGDMIGLVPDDGGYDPVDCLIGPLWCTDDRVDLGEASGVPVAVVRNPKAWITNFGEIPAGLRVYDAPDDGPDFMETLLSRPWSLPARVTEAHDSVLENPDVATCIIAEMRTPGTCGLDRAGRIPGPAVWPGPKPKWGPTGPMPI